MACSASKRFVTVLKEQREGSFNTGEVPTQVPEVGSDGSEPRAEPLDESASTTVFIAETYSSFVELLKQERELSCSATICVIM